ncbi:hypothetical protein [uncultured Shimia sp.]|uniref:hypothetical protein n=1 Tax=uncultured Shimia sp. TaxID=573152 RepID=UPI00260FBCC6|nr:hypothetical protein [uncultured Shimia sp.]
MAIRKLASMTLVGAVALLSFWAGSTYRDMIYSDACLDIGGGREPGGHQICVLVAGSTPLRLGPILIMPEYVATADVEVVADGDALLNLGLNKDVAAALAAYTENAIGKPLDIVVGGQLVNSVEVREAVTGTQISLAMPAGLAEKVLKDLNAGRN